MDPEPEVATPSYGLEQALQAAATTTANSLYSKNTRVNYDGYIQQGRVFLSTFNRGELATAFDVVDETSPTALLSFVAYKCDHNNASYKTAELIRSAFKQHFRNNLKCLNDQWRQDTNGQWIGNPVSEQTFTNYMTSLKKLYGKTNMTKQSLAMSYKSLSVLMEHFRKPETVNDLGESICLFFRAFAATGFTVWTRYPLLHYRVRSTVFLQLHSHNLSLSQS
jgi:hypothetical protein